MNTVYETAEATIRVREDGKLYTMDCVSDGLFYVGYSVDSKIPGPSTSVLMIA